MVNTILKIDLNITKPNKTLKNFTLPVDACGISLIKQLHCDWGSARCICIGLI